MASRASGSPSSNWAKRLPRSLAIFSTGSQHVSKATGSASHHSRVNSHSAMPATTPRINPSNSTR
ncbi:hypothetical protein D3C85_1855700 [compost metagenome]